MHSFANARDGLRKSSNSTAPVKSPTKKGLGLKQTGEAEGTSSCSKSKLKFGVNTLGSPQQSPDKERKKLSSKTPAKSPLTSTLKANKSIDSKSSSKTSAKAKANESIAGKKSSSDPIADCKTKVHSAGALSTSTAASQSKKPSKVFSTTASTLTVTKEMQTYIQRLKELHVIASVETTTRDNDLVAAMLHVANNDATVGEIMVDADPRFAHIANSSLLDFADGIRTNFYLTTLCINRVELGNGFLSSLADSIRVNLTLEKVDLRHNSFTSDAIVEFSLAMAHNKGLRHVDLRSQHSPIHSQQEKAVLEALSENSYVQSYQVEFRSEKCQEVLSAILKRNEKKDKKIKDREKKLLDFLRKETEKAEEEEKARAHDQEEVSRTLDEKDCDYFYELANLARKYKIEQGAEEKEASPCVPNFAGPSKQKLGKSLDFPGSRMTADGSFLTADFISTFLVEDSTINSLAFEFTNQFKIFKRFTADDPSRGKIVEKFVDALVNHPRSDEITAIQMANTCIADDFVQNFSERCLSKNKLKNLHQINIETNFVTGPGLEALAKCIAKPEVWKYLNSLKLDNQKSPIKTQAEIALANAISANCTIIGLSFRVRNLRERERINQAVQRNMDFLRQARQLYLKKTGKAVQRARNKMEQVFDSVAANDSKVSGEVSIVGDQVFLSLHHTEVVKAAASFNGNEHVTSVKMSLLKLDDKFALELAKSIEHNTRIEKLILDNNAISGEGLVAIFSGLGKNKSITELQVRHQCKPISSADEEKLVSLLQENETIIKLGVDLRNQQVRSELDRKLRQNQELKRKARVADNKGSGLSVSSTHSSESMIKSNIIEKLLQRVIDNDPKVSEVVLEGDKEFIQMPYSKKKDFLMGLKKNTNVKKLVLNGVELDNTFADDVAMVLASNSTVETISVDRNAFTSNGILAISLAANKHKNVKSLSIRKPRFQMTNDDAEILLQAMEKKSKMKQLDIEFRDNAYANRAEKVTLQNS